MTPIATRRMTFILAMLAVASSLGPLWASTTPGSNEYEKQESEIPRLPVAPSPIPAGSPHDTFRCARFFTWKGRQFECDSFVRQDAEKLRTIVADVPQAVDELNEYQATRARLHNAAYIGSAGLLLTVVGLVLRPHLRDYPPIVQNSVTFLGLGTMTGSLIYGFGAMTANEQRIGSAVQFYNTAHPDTPIELHFSTGFTF